MSLLYTVTFPISGQLERFVIIYRTKILYINLIYINFQKNFPTHDDRRLYLHKNSRSWTWKHILRKCICCLEGISWHLYALYSRNWHISVYCAFETHPGPCFSHNGILPRFRRISQCQKHWKAEKGSKGCIHWLSNYNLEI